MKRCKNPVYVSGVSKSCVVVRWPPQGRSRNCNCCACTRPTPPIAQIDYPSNKLANIADLVVNEPVDIEYPDTGSPGFLLKLGSAVEGSARSAS